MLPKLLILTLIGTQQCLTSSVLGKRQEHPRQLGPKIQFGQNPHFSQDGFDWVADFQQGMNQPSDSLRSSEKKQSTSLPSSENIEQDIKVIRQKCQPKQPSVGSKSYNNGIPTFEGLLNPSPLNQNSRKPFTSRNSGSFSSLGNSKFSSQNRDQFSTMNNNQFSSQNGGQFPSLGNNKFSSQNGGPFSSLGNNQFTSQNGGQFSSLSNNQFSLQNGGQFSSLGNNKFSSLNRDQFPSLGNNKILSQGNNKFSSQNSGQFSFLGNNQFSQLNNNPSQQFPSFENSHLGGSQPVRQDPESHLYQVQDASDDEDISVHHGAFYVQQGQNIFGVEPLCNFGTCHCPLLHYYDSSSKICLNQMSSCGDGQFKCSNGRCVGCELTCDGFVNCLDGSDEIDCIPECSSSQFMCSDGKCIDEQLRCNGVKNCVKGTDETNCTECKDGLFQCSSGVCIQGQLRCDGVKNCPDGTDETNCISECNISEFQCSSGVCIEGQLRCDGVKNCPDGTDESSCTQYTCPRNHFQCISDGICKEYNSTRCNSIMECEDGSDEAGCDCSILGGCDANAKCILPHGSTSHICECNVGSAGNGEVCGPDQDLDGFPNTELNCNDEHCHKDNCPKKPNSGQEDIDNNGIGDACDTAVPTVTRPRTPPCSNSRTRNCIPDSDGDGIENSLDNCPDVPNENQINSDGDLLGDACDNCPNVTNDGQEDKDQDMVGDACDNGHDRDLDGIQDDMDNCPDVPNAEQLNSDDDAKGNACDDDADNDGVPNHQDNCWLVYNPSQGPEDQCLSDKDNDGVDNIRDNCPNNYNIHKVDFRTFNKVDLDPFGTSQMDPIWVIQNDGAEITQTENSDPGLLFGKDAFDGVDFEGTFYIDDEKDDDYAGFIFSYQSNSRFYMMQWKNGPQAYWKAKPFRAEAQPAITLKKVNSIDGPGEALRNALWHTGHVINQTELLWTDPANFGWEPYVAYRWQLLHRPQIGLIRLRVLKGATLIADSGNIFDNEIKGGRLGAFVFSQEDVIWSNLGYRCNDEVPQNIYDNLPATLQNKVDIDHSWNWW